MLNEDTMHPKPPCPPLDRPSIRMKRSEGGSTELVELITEYGRSCQWARQSYRERCAKRSAEMIADAPSEEGVITRDQALEILQERRWYYESIARRFAAAFGGEVVDDFIEWVTSMQPTWTLASKGFLSRLIVLRALDRRRREARRFRIAPTEPFETTTDAGLDPEQALILREEAEAALIHARAWTAGPANDNGTPTGHEMRMKRRAILANVLNEREHSSAELGARLGISDSRVRHLSTELERTMREHRARCAA